MSIRELQIGKPLSEFPGGTINKVIREVNRLTATQLPRKRNRRGGGGGGGGGDAIGTPTDIIPPATEDDVQGRIPSTGPVHILVGGGGYETGETVQLCENWALTGLDSSNYVIIGEIGGNPVIKVAFC